MAIQTLHLGHIPGQSLASGLGEGLSMLLHHKVKDITRQKRAKEWESIGLPENVSQFLVNQPEEIQHSFLNKFLGPQGISSENGASSPSHLLNIEKRKDKLRPELEYIEDLSNTVKEMKRLLPETKFGAGSNIASNIPLVGNTLLDEATGTFNHLGNKFITDAAQKSKGVRSVYHVKTIAKSKPGLDKTKEQNERLLNHWEKELSAKKSKFLKAHPEFADEIIQDDVDEASDNAPDIEQDEQGNIYINGTLAFKQKGG